MLAEVVKRIGEACGFELVGIAPAEPPADFARYQSWAADGMAASMSYLTDHRADLRQDVRRLLPEAKSVICVGKLYNTPGPPETQEPAAHISRYAWGGDYHHILREGMLKMVARLRELEDFQWRVCVDTAPVLERSLARLAGLGWIGKNTCLINEPLGSWFFLGEILTSLELEPSAPPPDRCGSCTRCIEACPTDAIVPKEGGWTLDSRRCISYFTIEHRGPIPEAIRPAMGDHLFGCDICQEVCPWNRRAPETADGRFAPHPISLKEVVGMDQTAFRQQFKNTPLTRAKRTGILRNAATAMGNVDPAYYGPQLECLASDPDPVVREHAEWALTRALEPEQT